ncbi:Putative uncharacterized transposon-derived protein F52C9.6 [Eumeta japonica]|uniref:Uncharacterized transposon-derived protein F52C9.6 n=1 Tax=Eumeta variegata TaxID=151549 RepID=A0A4C1VDU9_EUMVA|nr:Putative uncharacterized transposon-derived protein F52C9.6 [Eumeta japonica]
MERSMLGVTLKYSKRAADIRSVTKVEDGLTKIRRLKWRWTGHITRESRMKWTIIITEWQPRDDKRKRDLCDFFDVEGLHALNEGNTPTFEMYTGDRLFMSVVDVTACSSTLLDRA